MKTKIKFNRKSHKKEEFIHVDYRHQIIDYQAFSVKVKFINYVVGINKVIIIVKKMIIENTNYPFNYNNIHDKSVFELEYCERKQIAGNNPGDVLHLLHYLEL